jgi:hypothetical protein
VNKKKQKNFDFRGALATVDASAPRKSKVFQLLFFKKVTAFSCLKILPPNILQQPVTNTRIEKSPVI